MRLFSTAIDGYTFDIVQLPDNPQFSELSVYGHLNQLVYSFMFQSTVVFNETVTYDVNKHKSGTYDYYRLDVKCSVYGFSVVLLPLGNDILRPICTENWQEIKGTKLRVTTKHGGLVIRRVLA